MHSSHMVLIIADDPEFSREVLARWKRERNVPGFTVMSTDLFSGGTGSFDLAIVGAVRSTRLGPVLRALDLGSQPAICVLGNPTQIQAVRDQYSRILVEQQHPQWLDSLVLLGTECLRRADLSARLRKAEQTAAANGRAAALGRYMLENRHDFSNLLTSVLGNAELLLLDGDSFSDLSRDQIQTIHQMALQMHELMQRFYSIAVEMQVGEKPSQRETLSPSQASVSVP